MKEAVEQRAKELNKRERDSAQQRAKAWTRGTMVPGKAEELSEI